MFISGGENIYPEEIESVLLDLPGIRQAVVVPIQDERFGSRPVAFVDVEEIQLTSILDYLSDRLPKFKIPDAFLPWPRDASPAGLKPGRQELKRLASSQMGNQRQSS
jgi:O-succinylbenzoic acid--CoA ligase